MISTHTHTPTQREREGERERLHTRIKMATKGGGSSTQAGWVGNLWSNIETESTRKILRTTLKKEIVVL